MRVRDYLNQVSGKVTFVKVDIEELQDARGFYMDKYYTTPIRAEWEWLQSSDDFLDMIVVNKDCPPIDVSGTWQNWYKQGHLNCCMIESEETIRTRYSEKQAQQMLDYYEKTIK